MFITRGKPIKTKPRYYISFIRLAETLKFDKILCWQDWENRPSCIWSGGNTKRSKPYMERNLAIPSKITYVFTLWPSNPISRSLSQRYTGKNETRCKHKAMHRSTICNSKKTRNHSNIHKQGLDNHTRMTLQLKREGGESLDDVMTSSPGYNVKWKGKVK